MKAVLIGASPFGSRVLTKLGVPYFLIADPSEDPNRVEGNPIKTFRLPFEEDPFSIMEIMDIWTSDIKGVFSFTEFGLLPAAILSETLRNHGVSVGTVNRTRNKFVMREFLKGKINQPRYGFGTSDHIKYENPIIIKPLDGTGSENINYMDKNTTLQTKTKIFWEQYIEGDEYSIEAVSSYGRHQILGITQKVTTGPPYFVEQQHVTPAQIDEEMNKEIVDYIIKVLDLLGIQFGATHTEIKVHNNIIYLIETHTRPGGDRIPYITKLVTGLDQYELAVRSILPKTFTCKEYFQDKRAKYKYASTYFFKWRPGKVKSIRGLDRCNEIPGVEELKIDFKDEIKNFKDSSNRPGFVVVGGESLDDLQCKISRINSLIHITYEGE